jgi:hypothetical protein
MIYDSLNYFCSDNRLTFEPTTVNASIEHESLVINRKSFDIKLNEPPKITNEEKHSIIYGIMGIINLNSGIYAILITGRKRVEFSLI